MKYQLADEATGHFGDIFETYNQAEEARTEHIAEFLEDEAEYLLMEAEDGNFFGEDGKYASAIDEVDGDEAKSVMALKCAKERAEAFVHIEEVEETKKCSE